MAFKHGSKFYMEGAPDYRSMRINGHDLLAATFHRMNVLTGFDENVTFYVTRLRDGRIFYMVSVSPRGMQGTYGSLFQKILESVKLND